MRDYIFPRWRRVVYSLCPAAGLPPAAGLLLVSFGVVFPVFPPPSGIPVLAIQGKESIIIVNSYYFEEAL